MRRMFIALLAVTAVLAFSAGPAAAQDQGPGGGCSDPGPPGEQIADVAQTPPPGRPSLGGGLNPGTYISTFCAGFRIP